ncbi:unnamed protein product [Lactuca saligna]|uniref:Uncharacterized protein n=1 Tax=Lactuca saligna TaxID=75948 RepID=A0AA35ZYW1_LACSI|nr:unnamed protein product [Lactuca saligna]
MWSCIKPSLGCCDIRLVYNVLYHNFQKLWETNVQEDFPQNAHHREMSIYVSNYTLKHGDVGGMKEMRPHRDLYPFEAIKMAEESADKHQRSGSEKEYSPILSKKLDQCRTVYACLNLFWVDYRDGERILLCLKRALKIANVAQQMANVAHGSSSPITLFVEILKKKITMEFATEKSLWSLLRKDRYGICYGSIVTELVTEKLL